MKNRAIFLECTEKMKINKKTTPEFDLLYRRAILLSLREQGFLDDLQVRRCLAQLTHFVEAKENTLSLAYPSADSHMEHRTAEETKPGKVDFQ